MAWAPQIGEDRRKDYARAQGRARGQRRNETPHEKRLWKLLRVLNRDDGGNFRRQANVGQRVFDFADLGRCILIELDGGVHDRPEVQAADKAKEIGAILRGYRVVRITNEELRADPGGVIERLRKLISHSSPHRGEGREGGRPTGPPVSNLNDGALRATRAPHSERPLPLTPAPRGGGGGQ